MEDKIVWQPSLGSKYGFEVRLDRAFARDTVQAKIPAENQKRLNVLAYEELKRFRINYQEPYRFHEDSCFVREFHLGMNGIWLTTDHYTVSQLVKDDPSLKKVNYHSHNVDVARDAFALMTLVDIWVKYSDILKEKWDKLS